MMRLFILAIAAFSLVLVSLPEQVSAHHPYNDFNHSNLISDSKFRDTSTMGTSDIQKFLNGKGGDIASYVYKDSGHTDHNKTAAQIISKYAQRYGINPQVILATLQKEQSLVTATNPHSSQYRSAMGYACPTGGSCDSKYAGFANQVDNGTWQLRLNFERASGNNNWWNSSISYACKSATHFYNKGLFPGNRVGFRVSSSESPYRTATLKNAATAALYCYTPHAYSQYYTGSHNFVVSFENWFGSTFGTPFFKIGNTKDVYILGSKDNYYRVPSMNVLRSYGYGKNIDSPPLIVDSSYVSGLDYSGNLTLLAKYESAPIYLMDAGGKHHFDSKTLIVDVFGYDWPDESSDGDISYLRQQDEYFFTPAPKVKRVIKERGGSPIYYIENGAKRHIVDGAAYNSGEPAYSSSSSMELSKYYLSTLPRGSMIFAPGTLYRLGNTAPVYIINDFDSSLKVVSKAIFDHFGFSASQVRTLSSSHVSGYPVSGSLNHVVQAGNIWLIHGSNYRNHLPDDTTASSTYALEISSIPTLRSEVIRQYTGRSDLKPELVKADNDSRVYLLEDGKKRWITSREALRNEGYSLSQVITLANHYIANFPSGENIN